MNLYYIDEYDSDSGVLINRHGIYYTPESAHKAFREMRIMYFGMNVHFEMELL